jgi:hypothetical protein
VTGNENGTVGADPPKRAGSNRAATEIDDALNLLEHPVSAEASDDA